MSEDPLSEPKKEVIRNIYLMENPIQDKLAILKCASQVKAPTIAIQFRQSICRNPTNWKDKGHEDCIMELDKMLASFLPPNISVGLKRANLATGTQYMKNDPNLLSVECDVSHEKQVTRELLKIFSPTSRRDQIRDKQSVPWIATPYFKGQDMQSDKRYIPEYTEIKLKEKIYQEDLFMRYIPDIIRLDEQAPESKYLAKEVLKQLENMIWDKGETPIRALIYDKLWEDTKESLKDEWLQKKHSTAKSSSDWLNQANEAISVKNILERMNSLGYQTLAPYDSQSFPTPHHSKRTLREYLMSIRSRRTEDLKDSIFVFESVNHTDDGRVLITFLRENEDEACTIIDNLPLFIQHEMNLDPSFFLSVNMLRTCQGNYYNPLTRTGITAVAQSLTETKAVEPNPRMRIPQGIRTANAQELEEIFKRTENSMFSFTGDEDLRSLAESVSSYQPIPEKSVDEVGAVMNLQTLLQTHHVKGNHEEVSVLSEGSGYIFDSQASRARFEIEKRADVKVKEALKETQLKQGVILYNMGQLTPAIALALNLDMQEVIECARQRQHSDTEDPPQTTNTLLNSQEVPRTAPDTKTKPSPNTTSYEDPPHDLMVTEMDDDIYDDEADDDCDMSHSSDKTIPIGSPSKEAPGGLNTGRLS